MKCVLSYVALYIFIFVYLYTMLRYVDYLNVFFLYFCNTKTFILHFASYDDFATVLHFYRLYVNMLLFSMFILEVI